MEIPESARSQTFRSSYLWFDEDGIVYSVPKPDAPVQLNREETEEELRRFKEFIGDKKVCLLIESNPKAKPPGKEERDYIAEFFNKTIRAMAIVTTSPVSRMIANLFFGLRPPAYPAKMFSNDTEAKKWLKQFLEKD